MKVSILLLTINRFAITQMCVGKALETAGTTFELLVADNGSDDRRTIDLIDSYSPEVFIQNKRNRGIGKMYNTMLDLARGEYICIIDNDILLPENWLADAVRQYGEKDGILGWKCVETPQHPDFVFGTKFFSKARQEEIGKFVELSKYGLEDSDYNHRMITAGYTNRYIGTSEHLGVGEHDEGEYRAMKNRELHTAWEKANNKFEGMGLCQ
jgi:glycosyltransferase involved in cell wall biosynthesis